MLIERSSVAYPLVSSFVEDISGGEFTYPPSVVMVRVEILFSGDGSKYP